MRQQAGVQLKNFLYTNDESLRAHYEERWLAMPEEIRNYTKVRFQLHLHEGSKIVTYAYISLDLAEVNLTF